MSKLIFYLFATQLIAPFLMPVETVYGQAQNMILQGEGFDAVFISVKTNDQVVTDLLADQLRSYIKSRLDEIDIKSLQSKDDKSGAELVLSFHIRTVNDYRKFLGYESNGQRKYIIFMQLFLLQPVTLYKESPIQAVVPTLVSSMEWQIGSEGHRPFISRSVELRKDIFVELTNLMDGFTARYKSTSQR